MSGAGALLAGLAAAGAVLVWRAPRHVGAGATVARRLAAGSRSAPGSGPRDAAGGPGRPAELARSGGRDRCGSWDRAGRWATGPGSSTGLPERLAGAVRRVAHRPANPAADRRLGRALVVGALLAVLHPLAGLAAGGAAWARPALRARRRQQVADRAVLDGAVDVVDLFRLAVAAGLTVPLAVEVVAPRVEGAFGDALAEVRRRVGLGVRWSEALAALGELGEPARPLAASLVAAERDGSPLAWPLEQASHDARLARRRAAEADARRLPVQLLFPLVLCTLPAFGLLTVVPLVVGTLGSLPT